MGREAGVTTSLQELRSRTVEVLVKHYPNWMVPGVCRCGHEYGDSLHNTWAQHAAQCLFPPDTSPRGAEFC